ncbi:MAG: type IV toxin-antitoxin system AbiEi family antitoxin [Chromatiales bacterium]|nr:hypothetical protein [Gammaproteobacteria bacterium]
MYVYVTGNRPQERGFMPTRDGAKRAFEPKGLMVLFAFLCHPELVKVPYREIAARAGVAVGTVGWVLNGLKAAVFVHDKGAKKGRRLVHYRKLLERWVEAYPEKLKPKQLVGEFTADDPYWWKAIDIRVYNAYWGGEIAAAKYTDYLNPKVATVYLPEQARTRLLRDVRLRKATTGWAGEPAGTVLIYRPFWPEPPNGLDSERNIDSDDVAQSTSPFLSVWSVTSIILFTSSNQNKTSFGALSCIRILRTRSRHLLIYWMFLTDSQLIPSSICSNARSQPVKPACSTTVSRRFCQFLWRSESTVFSYPTGSLSKAIVENFQ